MKYDMGFIHAMLKDILDWQNHEKASCIFSRSICYGMVWLLFQTSLFAVVFAFASSVVLVRAILVHFPYTFVFGRSGKIIKKQVLKFFGGKRPTGIDSKRKKIAIDQLLGPGAGPSGPPQKFNF